MEVLMSKDNAFNQQHNAGYLYQYDDMRHICEELCDGIDNIVLVAPLGFEYVQTVGQKVSTEVLADQIRKFDIDLKQSKKVVGCFNTGATHWIAYTILNENGQYKCYYKDSMNQQRVDFEKVISEAFLGKCESKKLGIKQEQQDSTSCGIFAAQNLYLLAENDPTQVEQFFDQDIPEIFQARADLANLYLQSYLKEYAREELRQFIGIIHNNEAEILKQIIYDKIMLVPKNAEINTTIDGLNYYYSITPQQEDVAIIKDFLLKSGFELLSETGAVLSVRISDKIDQANFKALLEVKQKADNTIFVPNLTEILRNTSINLAPTKEQQDTFIEMVKAVKFNINANVNMAYNFANLDNNVVANVFTHASQETHEYEAESLDQDTNNVDSFKLWEKQVSTSEIHNLINQEVDGRFTIYPVRHDNDVIIECKASASWSGFTFMRWDKAVMDLSINTKKAFHQQFDYYPKDLVYGLLSEHVASETGMQAGRYKIKPGDKVQITRATEFSAIGNVNSYLTDWNILGVLDDADTGYCGIVYENAAVKQLVLAHRSTNFALSLTTKNMFKGSGAQQDFSGVLMGRILGHQALGYIATKEAVNLLKHPKYQDYSLSVTGHSLGAWLAEMSAYYCDRSLGYKGIKTVTFDGPGSLEMMERLSKSEIQNGDAFDKTHLNIVSYFSAPNIVNAANKHVGTAYRVFPEIEHTGSKFLTQIPIVGKVQQGLLATYGHDLKHILSHFDPTTGKPKQCKEIQSWPSITHENFGKASAKKLIEHIADKIKTCGITGKIVSTAIEFGSMITKDSEPTTLETILQLALDFMHGKIQHKEFWLVHEFLDPNNGYRELVPDSLAEFLLQIRTGYQTKDANLKVWSKKIDKGEDDAERYLKLLDKDHNYYSQKMQGSLFNAIQTLCTKYYYDVASQTLEIHEDYKSTTTIEDLKNNIMHLRHRHDLDWFMKNAKVKHVVSNLQQASKEVDIDETTIAKIHNGLSLENKIIVVSPAKDNSVEALAKYANLHTNDFTTVVLKASSKEVLLDSLKKLNGAQNTEEESIDSICSTLKANKQQILFIFEEVRNLVDIKLVLEKLSSRELTNRIKIGITTCDDSLQGAEHVPQVHIDSAIDFYENDQKLSNTTIAVLKHELTTEELDTLHIKDQLRSSSLVQSKSNGKFVVSTKSQEVARSNTNKLPAWDFLRVVSNVDLHCIDTTYVKNHIKSFITTPKIMQFWQDFDAIKGNIQDPGNMLKLCETIFFSNKDTFGNQDTKIESAMDYLRERSFTITERMLVSLKHESNSNFVQSFLLELARSKPTSIDTIEPSTNNKHVIFVGPTGSGKSTIINGLLGNKLFCERVGEDGQPSIIKLLGEAVSIAPAIGNDNAKSQTSKVKKWESKSTSYFDTPGFGDSRGALYEMHNGYALNSLQKVAEKAVLVITVTAAAINASKGKDFVALLEQLDRSFKPNEIKNHVVLAITQVSNPDIDQYLKSFQDIDVHLRDSQGISSGFLQMFLSEAFRDKIQFVRKIGVGEVNVTQFQNLNQSIQSLIAGKFTFNAMNISRDSRDALSIAGEAVNKYAADKIGSLAEKQNEKLKTEIEAWEGDIAELKKTLKQKVNFGETDDREKLLDKVSVLDKECADHLKQAIDCLTLFGVFNNTVKPQISSWGANLRELSNNYHLFAEGIRDTAAADTLLVQGIIVGTSEIDDAITQAVRVPKAIFVRSSFFVADKSVCWQYADATAQGASKHGTNLAVLTDKFKTTSNNTIDLSGAKGINTGDKGGNGGRLAIYTKEPLFGGVLTIDLNGGCGADGVYSSVQERLSFHERKAKELSSILSTLRLLQEDAKDLRKGSLDIIYDTTQIQQKIGDITQSLEQKQDKLNHISKTEEDLKSVVATLQKAGATRKVELNSKKAILMTKQKEKSELEVEIEELKQQKCEQENLANFAKLQGLMERMEEYKKECDSIKESVNKIESAVKAIDAMKKEAMTAYLQTLRQDALQAAKSKDIIKLKQIMNEVNTLSKTSVAEQQKIIDSEVAKHKCKDLKTLAAKYSKAQELYDVAKNKYSDSKLKLFIAGKELEKTQEEWWQILTSGSKALKIHEEEVTKLQSDIKSVKPKLDLYAKKLTDYEAKTADTAVKLEQIKGVLNNNKQLENYVESLMSLRQIVDKQEMVLMQVIASKDYVVSGSKERFEKEEIAEARLLKHSNSKNYKNIVESYEAELSKIAKAKEVFEHKSTIETTKKQAEEVSNALVQYLEAKIAAEADDLEVKHELKPTNTGKQNAVKDATQKLEKIWANDLGWKTTFCTPPQEDALYTFADTICQKLAQTCNQHADFVEVFTNRINYATEHKTTIEQAYNDYLTALNTFHEKKQEYDKWKKLAKAEDLKKVITQFDSLLSEQQELLKLFDVISSTAEKLLLHENCLVSRIQRTWDDRSTSGKAAYLIKEILCFNRQFVEKYKLLGSKAGEGGDCGTLVLNGELITAWSGSGGSTSSLFGIYINEYSYSLIRGIKEVNELDKTGSALMDTLSSATGGIIAGGVTQGVKSAAQVAATEAAANGAAVVGFLAIPGIGWIIGGGLVLMQLIASPIIAGASCGWRDGPFFVKKREEDGKAEDVSNAIKKAQFSQAVPHIKLSQEECAAIQYVYGEEYDPNTQLMSLLGNTDTQT